MFISFSVILVNISLLSNLNSKICVCVFFSKDKKKKADVIVKPLIN